MLIKRFLARATALLMGATLASGALAACPFGSASAAVGGSAAINSGVLFSGATGTTPTTVYTCAAPAGCEIISVSMAYNGVGNAMNGDPAVVLSIYNGSTSLPLGASGVLSTSGWISSGGTTQNLLLTSVFGNNPTPLGNLSVDANGNLYLPLMTGQSLQAAINNNTGTTVFPSGGAASIYVTGLACS
jgi:hypothetical protein